jgi:hypothetical protein
MVLSTQPKRFLRRGLPSQFLPIPNANWLCPVRPLPAFVAVPTAGVHIGTVSHTLVVYGRLRVQRWQCRCCLGSLLTPASAQLYVHRVSHRAVTQVLDLPSCDVGAATLWRDVQAVAPTWGSDPQASQSLIIECETGSNPSTVV